MPAGACSILLKQHLKKKRLKRALTYVSLFPRKPRNFSIQCQYNGLIVYHFRPDRAINIEDTDKREALPYRFHLPPVFLFEMKISDILHLKQKSTPWYTQRALSITINRLAGLTGFNIGIKLLYGITMLFIRVRRHHNTSVVKLVRPSSMNIQSAFEECSYMLGNHCRTVLFKYSHTLIL